MTGKGARFPGVLRLALVVVVCVGLSSALPLLPSPAPGRDSSGQKVALPIIVIDNCGDDLCQCQEKSAECMGQDIANYVPLLPEHIESVVLATFNFDHVTDKTLVNLTRLHLVELKLVATRVRTIDASVLAPFQYLELLWFEDMALSEKEILSLLKSVSQKPLHSVELTGVNLQNIDILNAILTCPLTEVIVSDNSLREIDFQIFRHFERLESLDLKNNGIENMASLGHLHLQTLYLNQNRLAELPNFCPENMPAFPKLEWLEVSDNWIVHMDVSKLQCLQNLQMIDISKNHFSRLYSNTFSYLPRLLTIDANSLNFHLYYIQSFTFNNSNLMSLSLTGCGLCFELLGPNVFGGCENLQKLTLNDNIELRTLTPEMFAPLRSLEVLSATGCSLISMPTFLEKLPFLETLLLQDNEMTQINSSLMERLTQMTTVDFSHNRLTFDHGQTIPTQVQDKLNNVNLVYNRLVCSCESLWLKVWVQRAQNMTNFDGFQDLTCLNDPYRGMQILDVPITEESCLLDHTSRQIVVATSAVLLLVLVVFPLVYRYRWQLQYLVFMLRYDRGQQNQDQQQQQQRHFRYDAFVIYDSRNHAWVRRQLMPALEDREGLRLCIHERDFLAGKLIVDNIVDSITASRKVIVVISEALAASEWCQFELSLSHRLVLEGGRDLMVVVMLEKIARGHLTRTMYAVLKTTTYISWPDEERAREAFWERLAEAVR